MMHSAVPPLERLEQRRLLSFGPGDPFLVNTFTTQIQASPAIATQPNGDYVIAWESNTQDTSNYGIYAQRFSAAGAKVGPELQVNTYTTGQQRNPSIACDDAGNFVVAWQSQVQTAPGDTDNYGVYARRYLVSGATATPGPEFVVNTDFTGIQREPAVAMDSDGDFVIVWRSPDGANDGIFARRYDETGAALAVQFAVNTVTANNQLAPAVDMYLDGDFVVTWQSYNHAAAGSGFDIVARRYKAALNDWENTEQLVNVVTTDAQEAPSIAITPAGIYVIAWHSNLQDGNLRGVFARRFNSAGAPLSDPFQVNVFTTNNQRNATVGIGNAGQFVVTWGSQNQDSSLYGVYARRYDAAGTALDLTDQQVNTYVTAQQNFPAVAMDADGDFVIAWHSGNNQDGSMYGVYARRYSESNPVATPQVTSGNFIWQNAPQRLEFVFDMDVSASLDSSDLVLQNLTSATTIDPSLIQMQWIAGSNTLRYTFPTLPNGGSLLNGHYRATLVGSGINAGGPSMAQDYVLNFFFVNGDADHNGNVDVNDLGLLATNWQLLSGQQYGVGDFDYSGTVDVNDLGILATSWQFSLGPAPAPALASRKTTPTKPAATTSQAATIVESARRPASR
jgi:hypothetical protein